MPIKIRDAKDCKYDLVSLGECMIRLSPPGHGRVEFAPSLEVWVGGGEYNVAYALARLGLRTAAIFGTNTSPMGKIILNHARAVGMDVSHAVVRKYDGYGKKDRVGLNFTEVGHGKRASTTLYDRGHSATAGIKPGEIDWNKLFKEDGVRWLHTPAASSRPCRPTPGWSSPKPSRPPTRPAPSFRTTSTSAASSGAAKKPLRRPSRWCPISTA